MEDSPIASPLAESRTAGLHDPVADRLGYLLRRASATMMADLGLRLGEIGLRPVEATVLSLVGANAGCTQSDLGRVLGIQRANMVPLMTGLLDKGLLHKVRVDGRSFALSLTAEGDQARRSAERIMDAHEARFEALMSAKDRENLLLLLGRIAGSPSDPIGE